MKVTRTTSMHEIKQLGLAALARELGPYGLIRFLQQYEVGSGDYTQDRHKWLGDPSIDDIVAEIKVMRRQNATVVGKPGRRRKVG